MPMDLPDSLDDIHAKAIPYDFPFDALIYCLMSQCSLDEHKNYFKRWSKIFADLDSICAKEMKLFEFKRAVFDTNSNKYETYNFEHDMPDISAVYRYNFDMEQIKIRAHNRNSISCSVELLNEIAWYTDKQSHDILIDLPIFLFPYHVEISDSNVSDYLVVDGNKRLCYALKNNIQYIDAIIFDDVQRSDFITSIDWAMFTCMNDAVKLRSQDVHISWSDTGILNSSKFNAELKHLLS